MSKRVEQKSGNTMIVLGAGASIGAKRYPKWTSVLESSSKMPSSQIFFYDIFYQSETDWSSERFINFLGFTYEDVNRLLVHGWGLTKNISRFDPKEWKNLNVEDVFTFLDVGEKMFNKGTRAYRVFSESKKRLVDFIFTTLSHRCEMQHCEYLMRVFSNLKPEDNILSFNWDTLADVTLEYCQPQYLNYLELMAGNRITIRKYRRKGLLLKLHGSFNWVVCQNGDCENYMKPRLPLTKVKKKLSDLGSFDFLKCPRCNQDAQRLIVPPVTNKLLYKDRFLHKLWLLAYEKLLRADRIIFIGYSFPPTDFYSEWLFRQIHYLTGGKPDIVVVNPEMFKKGSLVSKRYKSLFRNCRITKYRTLAEFAYPDY